MNSEEGRTQLEYSLHLRCCVHQSEEHPSSSQIICIRHTNKVPRKAMATFYGFLVGLAIVFLAYSPSSSAVHFVLIHGSGHGAWCWYKLATLLEQAGHKVAAVDLAYSGRNQVPLEFVHTFDEYHKPLFKYLESLSPKEKVVLVGHSYGGYGVSSGLERFPEKVLGGVFASAFMVGPNFTLEDTNKVLGCLQVLELSMIFH